MNVLVHTELIRRVQWTDLETRYQRGLALLYREHVSQAHPGCDFDSLQGEPGETREPDIY